VSFLLASEIVKETKPTRATVSREQCTELEEMMHSSILTSRLPQKLPRKNAEPRNPALLPHSSGVSSGKKS